MKRKKHRICNICGNFYERQCAICSHDKLMFGGNRLKALKRDKYVCVKCGISNAEHIKKWKKSLHVDHVDGAGFGKKKKNNSLENLQTLCVSCHFSKDSHFPKHKLFGESKTLKEWANIYCINYRLVRCRVYVGKWNLFDALTRPLKKWTRKGVVSKP